MTHVKGPEGRDHGARERSKTDFDVSTSIAAKSLPRTPDATVAAVLQLLAERWPQVFSIHEFRRRPLKIGIHVEILAALDGAVTPAELCMALRCYCANAVYRKRLKAGAARIGLDGEPAGVITAEEEAYAVLLARLAASDAVYAQVRGDHEG